MLMIFYYLLDVKMPQKRKGQNANLNARPGKAKQHVMDNIPSLPGALNDLLNGHVVFFYLCSYESNRAKTVKFLSSFEEQGPVRLLEAAVIKVVRNLEKFQRLSRAIVFEKFDSMYREKFSFLMEQSETKQLSHASEMEPEPSPTPAKDSVISPVKNTRRTSKCESCKVYKKSLQIMRQRQLAMQREKLQTIRRFSFPKKREAVKNLNQKIKWEDT